MKTKKAISWETISEGLVKADCIKEMLENNRAIFMILLNTSRQQATTIQIVSNKTGKARKNVKYHIYNHADPSRTIPNSGNRVTEKPYRYLSCAIRKAVKEYKAALWTKQWKM